MIPSSSKSLSELVLIHLSIIQLPGPISELVILKALFIEVMFAIPPMLRMVTGVFILFFFLITLLEAYDIQELKERLLLHFLNHFA